MSYGPDRWRSVVVQRLMWTRSSRVPLPPTSPASSPRGSSSLSTARQAGSLGPRKQSPWESSRAWPSRPAASHFDLDVGAGDPHRIVPGLSSRRRQRAADGHRRRPGSRRPTRPGKSSWPRDRSAGTASPPASTPPRRPRPALKGDIAALLPRAQSTREHSALRNGDDRRIASHRGRGVVDGLRDSLLEIVHVAGSRQPGQAEPNTTTSKRRSAGSPPSSA